MARMRRKFSDRNEGIMNPNLRRGSARPDSSNYNYLPGKSTADYFGRSPLEELESKFPFGRDQISKRHRTGQNFSNYNYLPGKSTADYFGRSPLEELEGQFSFGRDQISKRHTPPHLAGGWGDNQELADAFTTHGPYMDKWGAYSPRQPGLDEQLMQDYIPPGYQDRIMRNAPPKWGKFTQSLEDITRGLKDLWPFSHGGLASLRYAR